MTRWMKWIGWMAAIVLVIACFFPWVDIPWKNFTATGMDAGPQFRSPAYGHFIFTFFFLLFTVVQKIWAKRSNLLVTSLNMGWAIRNYILLTRCSGGDCPEKRLALYLVLFSSILMLIASMFPDIKLPGKKDSN